jgi:hypothetical protein
MKTILLTILLISPFYAFLQNDMVIISGYELGNLFRDPTSRLSNKFSRKQDEKNSLKSEKYFELLLNPDNAYSNSLISKIEYHLNRQKYQIDAVEGVKDSVFNFNTTFGIQDFQFDAFNKYLEYAYGRYGVYNGLTDLSKDAQIETMNCEIHTDENGNYINLVTVDGLDSIDIEGNLVYPLPSCEFNYFLKDINGLVIFNFDENGVAPYNEKRIGFYKEIGFKQANGEYFSSNIMVFSSSLKEIEKVLCTSDFTDLITKTEKRFRKKVKNLDEEHSSSYNFQAGEINKGLILNLTQVNEISSIFYASEFFDPHFGRAIFKY